MKESIYIKYHWHTEDIVKAYKYHRRSSTACKVVDFTNLAFGIVYITLGLYGMSIGLIIFGLFLIAIRQGQIYFYARSYKKLNYENKQVEWEIGKDEIQYRMLNLLEFKFSWDFIHGILDTQKGFLLYPQQNMFYYLPKYAFDSEEDIARFVYLARDKVKNWQQIK